MLRAENIWFRYSGERWILKGLSFEIGYGIHCIVGPNGSGKTTLLRIIIGSLRPQKGNIYAFGKKIRNIRDSIGLMIYVPSNPTMFLVGPRVRDDLYKIAKDSSLGVLEVVDVLGICELLDKRIFELSEGQRHLVAIASAVLSGAKIVILDEPTVGLDRNYRSRILNLLKQFAQKRIIVVATNDIRFARESDSILILSDGKIVMHDKPLRTILSKDFMFVSQIREFAQKMSGLGLINNSDMDIRHLIEILRRIVC